MKIFIICSKHFYSEVTPIKESLEKSGHEIFLPNCFNNPETESVFRDKGTEEHSKWKAQKIKESEDKIKNMDAVLVINLKKNEVENYIGGATFIEMYDAFRLGKKIYMWNGIPDGMLKDEIVGFAPVIINKDLTLIK